MFTILALHHRPAPGPPVALVEDGLCIHSGWHYSHHRVRGEKPEYRLWGIWYWRTTDVPDGILGGNGEGGWTATSDRRYGGGMSFTIGTWNRAGKPYAATTYDIAHSPPQEQLRRFIVIVEGDHGSFGEWPQTSRACGV